MSLNALMQNIDEWCGTPVPGHPPRPPWLRDILTAVVLAELSADLSGPEQRSSLYARAAELYDRGLDAAEAANMAKFAAADASLLALDQAIQVHGGNGLAVEYGLADLWFIARLHKTAAVSREMILNYVAQHSLGLPKSY